MKFALVALLFCVGAASASLRLPLPKAIRHLHPELLTEAINSEANSKIVGGTEAAKNSAPHQIALLRSGSFSCGGSLISSNVILTAAHCVDGQQNNPSVFTIRYNTMDRTSGPTLGAKKVNKHPSYSSSTIDYDVATIILTAAFTPGTNAAVIQLTTVLPADGSIVKVTGWGRLSSGGSLPTKLQEATLTVVSKSQCQSAWGSVNSITDRMLCAHNAKQSACNGDSGGPLTQKGALVGVVSWGSSTCLHATYPNVYASVFNLRAWILANQS